jgi:hypothetical protein
MNEENIYKLFVRTTNLINIKEKEEIYKYFEKVKYKIPNNYIKVWKIKRN